MLTLNLICLNLPCMFCFRYQQYTINKHLTDRECLVQQEYEVDVDDMGCQEKVLLLVLVHFYLYSINSITINITNVHNVISN